MKLTKLTVDQKKHLKDNKEKFVSKFLNSEKIDKQKAIEVIKFVYSLIKRDMPKIYKVGDPLSAQKLANKLKGTEKKYYSFGTYLTLYWASFYAYYETFVDFGIITKEKFPKYFELRKFIDSNIFMTIEFEKAIIIVEKPMICLKNENGLHNLDGKAIEWENGYGQYYINGRCLSEKHFTSITNKKFKIEDFINEKNEEKKSTCIAFMQEKYGDEYLVDFFRQYLKEVDSFTDKKDEQYLKGTTKGMNVGVYTLFKGIINGVGIAYVRCYCPSTDRMFFLGVDDSYKTAKDAIASLYRIPSKLKSHIKSISRQGERFSTILTDKGNEVLKNMSKEEIEDVSGLDGNNYFSLMKYEY
jgi:hypothetical protein